VLLVATGADYQQFVLAAKTSRGAALGCLIAAVCLFVIAFLPPAVVVAFSMSGQISDQIANSKHVVPLALQKAAATGGAAWGVAMLVALSAAALGSGAAVVRAMSSALMSGVGGRLWRSNSRSTAVALAVGAVLASRGQGIVETMVSVNIIYIASVGVVLLLLIGRCSVPSRLAVSVMAAGFCCAGGLYLLRWAGLSHLGSDLHALITGLSASGLTLLIGKAMGARSARSASTSRG
jgi:SSS family solute:Na+ symporter